MLNRYGRLSTWIYDLDKPVGRSFGDIEFYRDKLAGCAGPILEPAVGTDRFLIPLLQAGFDVEGFDASDEMLERCRANCASSSLAPRLEKMRLQDFRYDRRFAAIVMPVAPFELVTDFAEALVVLRRLHDQLDAGGRLILDLDPISWFFADDDAGRSWTTSAGDLLTEHVQHSAVDYVAQRKTWHLRYEHWRDGRLVSTELEIFTLRWWGVGEFEMALKAAGFDAVTASGYYENGRPPRSNDRVITFEARKT